MSNQSWSCRNILFFFLASSNWKVVPLRPNVSTCKGLQTVRHRGITNAALQRGGRYRKSAGHRMKRQTRWHRCPPNVGARREGKKGNCGGLWDMDGLTERQKGKHTRGKHDASLHWGVMDGTRRLINQSQWNSRMLRRVFRATPALLSGLRAGRRVRNVKADAHT